MYNLYYEYEYGKKTPLDYPYSYDPFVIFDSGESRVGTNTVYTDMLLQQNHSKCNDLMEKHFGNSKQNWRDRSKEDIESFMRDWCNNPNLRVIRLKEYCNSSNGYPYWRIDYASND